MEKYTTLSELLYVGLVFEKGRCKSSGIWKRTYRKSLIEHIELLHKIAVCLETESSLEDVNSALQEVLNQIESNSILKQHYPITNQSIMLWKKGEQIITYAEEPNEGISISNLMVQLLEDILIELNKNVFMNKKKVSMLITSLHNLPRVYMDSDYETLVNLTMNGISIGEAIEYMKLSLYNDTKIRYQQFINIT